MSPRPTFDPGFSTEDLTAVFSADATVAAMLEFEAALALALSDVGIAPLDEAEAVANACRARVGNPDSILAAAWEDGTPLIELAVSVSAHIDNENARKWFHFGATSQDAVDTGLMIQAGHALGIIEPRLISLARVLRDVTMDYRDQPQMGRTFLQDARPITFGFRTASWLDAVIAHTEELRRQRLDLQIQLGGPVGDISSYGDQASRVLSSVAERLGLAEPNLSWHTNRIGLTALCHSVERAALTMGKIGSDVALLASSGIGEIKVRSGGSSSMPEKQNPIDAIRAVAAAQACVGAISMMTTGSGHELDRAIGGWHVEWIALPLVFQTAGAAVEAMETCIQSLQVDRERMSANAGRHGRLVPSDQIDRVLAAFERVIG